MASVDSMLESAPQRLRAFRQSLLRLHKVLLESEREVYERTHGRINNSYEVLQLVVNDPWFDWLHHLSEIVVQIDELLDAEESPSDSEVSLITNQTRALLTPSETGGEFQSKYFASLQQFPDAVLAHGEVMKQLGSHKPSA